ncbi:hypothetical protein DV735_g191, partial [Chaetothyriales sp. CBS 134920]
MDSLFLTVLIASGIIFVSVVAMSLFRTQNHFPADGRTILITGASQGLGLSAARQLASKGANVAIVARDVTKLESAIEEIRAAARRPEQQKFLSLSYDLTKPESARLILKEVSKWNGGQPPDVVWCCAGYALPSFFADASLEAQRSQMDTVYWSSAYMAHETINLWKQPAPVLPPVASKGELPPAPAPARHLIFTSSALAFFPIAGYTPYTVGKVAMRALADSLNQEVAVYNGARRSAAVPATEKPAADIKIHITFPMGIQGAGLDYENTLKPELTVLLEKDDVPQLADEVATNTIASLEKGEYMITTMFLGHLMKGSAMGSSLRSGIMDYLWNFLGSIVILFVAPDFLSKCSKWGTDRGLHTGPKAK